jgi:hypothetical protein
MNPINRAARVAGLLRCPNCSAVETFNSAELEKFTRAGWPTCCGETMSLFTETAKPTVVPHTEGETPLNGTKVE